MLSVITALEFFQHYFAKMGHRNTSCDPHLHPNHQATNAPYLTRSVRRTSGYVDKRIIKGRPFEVGFDRSHQRLQQGAPS
jgi:hypothetical protein